MVKMIKPQVSKAPKANKDTVINITKDQNGKKYTIVLGEQGSKKRSKKKSVGYI